MNNYNGYEASIRVSNKMVGCCLLIALSPAVCIMVSVALMVVTTLAEIVTGGV